MSWIILYQLVPHLKILSCIFPQASEADDDFADFQEATPSVTQSHPTMPSSVQPAQQITPPSVQSTKHNMPPSITSSGSFGDFTSSVQPPSVPDLLGAEDKYSALKTNTGMIHD